MTANKSEWPANIFVEVMKSKTKQFFHNLFHCRKERMKALKKVPEVGGEHISNEL